MTPVLISDSLRAKASSFQGGLGAEWLERLPGIIERCRERWGLTLGEGYSYPALSFLARCDTRDGAPAVLKVGFLLDELACEIEALRLCGGRGMVRLLDAMPEQGALLLERAEPGRDLAELRDDERATRIAAAVMARIHAPAPAEHSFPTVARWCRGFERLREHFRGGSGPFPPERVAWAERRAAELLVDAPAPVLLHGDLHHFNVVGAEREPWLAIDPKGAVGDPAYEPAAFLCNEWANAADPVALQTRRIRQFAAETGLDAARILDWARVHSVLSAWWCIEDGGEPIEDEVLRHIEVLAEVRIP